MFKTKMIKTNRLFFISIIFLFILIVNSNALVINKDGNFKGTIDKLRIYNRVLTEEEVRQYYYSNLYKYYINKWNFYTKQTNLTHGIYTYQGFAIDGAGNENKTEIRTLIINNPPTHSTPILNSSRGTNFTDEDLTCYNQSTYDVDNDIVINIIKWYKDGVEQSKLKNLTTISSSNTSIGDNWGCSIQPFDPFEYGIILFSDELTVTCIDNDGDGICDFEDQCPDQNQDDVPTEGEAPCEEWGFNSSGCPYLITYKQKGTVVGTKNCSSHELWGDPCYIFPHRNITCGDDGDLIDGRCDYELICEYDPDVSRFECAANFSKGLNEIDCLYFGDVGCWDDNWVPPDNYKNTEDAACCGDDVNISGREDECWVDDTNKSGCCYAPQLDKVVYITDPDYDGRFCNKVGEKLNKRSIGETADCDRQDEEYCFATALGTVSQDPNCCCCGDDESETWSLFISDRKLEDVIVSGSCKNGKWVEREEAISTLYDLWTAITS